MKIAILLSGGVDSSVALRLLRDAGHELEAFYIKVWLEDEIAAIGDCPWEEDVRYARAVCEQAAVPLHVLPLQTEYYDRIVRHAIGELRAGRTPSPDIHCNRQIKFGAFLDGLGDRFDRVASGHYARVTEADGRMQLRRAPDPVKDQTYFLCTLRQDQLRRACFPIGAMDKTQVRAAAQTFGLPTQARRDSQGVCFLGRIKYSEFIRFNLGERAGEIREIESDRLLGHHQGYWFFTIGQRQGLRLHGGPWIVVRKDIDRNIIYVAHRDLADSRAHNQFVVAPPHWIAGAPPDSTDLTLKLRHGPELLRARIAPAGDDTLTVTIEHPERGIAPGQYAVFYQDDICLGGAVIQST